MKHRSRVGLIGGLGNQLFQYAFGLWLGQSGIPVEFDASALRSGSRMLELPELLDDDLPIVRWTNLMPYPKGRLGALGELPRRIAGPSRIWYENAQPLPTRPCDAPSAWWYGYWQSSKIVQQVIGEVRKSMCAAVPPIRTRTIGLHVRRGDYVGNPMLLSPTYYRDALRALVATHSLDVSNFTVSVYSDDPTWCQSHLDLGLRTEFATPASTLQDFTSLMACEYLVLSRSTFSWWAASLPERPRRNVIAPYPFTPYQRDLELPGWLRKEI